MNLEEKLMDYKKITQIEPREEKIRETICIAKESYFASEQKRTLSYYEFLLVQFKVIQKRWWVFQFLILSVLWAVLAFEDEYRYVQRGMGVIAALFVVLMIPELWKNRSCRCMEIEASSYYSLKQIYAARMLLFGMMDILFLTVFCGVTSIGLRFKMEDLIVQFLFPLCVTACICFGILCSKRCFHETAAIALCILWSLSWLFLILNESIYRIITFPIWLVLLGMAAAFLIFIIFRTLKNCNRYWEVPLDGIGIL